MNQSTNHSTLNLTHLIITVFVISWIGVTPGLLMSYGVDLPPALKALDLLMVLGPLLGAVIFIYRTNGKSGLKALFSKLLIFRAKPLVILVACVLPIVVSYLGATIGHKISGTQWPETFTFSSIATNGLMIFISYLFLNTEEIAWRGVVFDRLFDRHGFAKACLIIGPIWWLFHMPLFLYQDGHPAGYGLLPFTGIVIAQTIILGWIYVSGRRSLAYCHIHHQLINGFGQAFPIFPVFIGGNSTPLWVFVGVLLVFAGLILLKMKAPTKKNVPAH